MEGLTVKQAAEALGYEPETIWKKIYNGQLKRRQFGRAVRIFEEDNKDLFKQRRELAASTAKSAELAAA